MIIIISYLLFVHSIIKKYDEDLMDILNQMKVDLGTMRTIVFYSSILKNLISLSVLIK